MPTLYHVTPISSNSKTGPLVVTTSGKQTCWDGCPFYFKGCYSGAGPLALHWDLITEGERGQPWELFLVSLRAALDRSAFKLWRHNQAGDLPSLNGDAATIDKAAVLQLAGVSKAAGKNGFTYTHKPATAANLSAVKAAAKAGFVINLSANNLEHADTLAATGLPICVTVPIDTQATFKTPAGRKGIICPAQQKENVSCATCGLCAKAGRSVLIGFRFHGTQHKAAAANAANAGTFQRIQK